MTVAFSDSSPGARRTAGPGLRSADGGVMRGRAAEQRIVRDLLRRARRGCGGVVLVEGEPGIGKSLLLRDAVGEAAGDGFSPAAGAADQLSGVIPLSALRAALPEPFAGLTADTRQDLPGATGWWIGQVRARLEQRAAANPVLVCRLLPAPDLPQAQHRLPRRTHPHRHPANYCWSQALTSASRDATIGLDDVRRKSRGETELPRHWPTGGRHDHVSHGIKEFYDTAVRTPPAVAARRQ